jgi:hypothetical protein
MHERVEMLENLVEQATQVQELPLVAIAEICSKAGVEIEARAGKPMVVEMAVSR